METLGQFLKREREFRSMSLEEVAQATKINRRFLVSIEQDEWRILPSGAFVKGFLKSYARYLGVPLEDVLRRFESEKPKEKSDYDPFQKFRGFEVKNRLFLFLVAAVVVILLAAVLSSR